MSDVGSARGPALVLEDLWVRDQTGRALVCGVDLTVGCGETVGLVGESGSGKTLTARAAIGLAPKGLTIDAARACVADEPVYGSSWEAQRRVLGTKVGFIPQNTVAFLQPSLRVGVQMTDGYRTWHPRVSRREADERAVELLRSVGLKDAARVMGGYPGELSGGMRQRVNIAMALMGDPLVLVADEPTAALDSVTQAQVVELLGSIARERAVALLMISHDLALVRQRCDRVYVMYAGRCVECGPAAEVAARPGHPYTWDLMAAEPRVGMDRSRRLRDIPGTMPEDGRDADACTFMPRCPLATSACSDGVPPWEADGASRGGHRCACRHPWKIEAGEVPR